MNFAEFLALEDENLKFNMTPKKDVVQYGGDIDWKGKIIWMSPERFLHLAAPLPSYLVNRESIENLKSRFQQNQFVDPLVLCVDMATRKIIGHEGRHRAKVCMEVGVKEVPVLIFTGSGYDRTPNWTPEQHKDVEDAVNFTPERH